MVDPRKVRLVEMRDGTKYHVGRNGAVALSADHSAEVAKYGQQLGETGYIGPTLGYVDLPGRTCGCGFTAWPWQHECGRCGAAL
jgi:hypothetical protein